MMESKQRLIDANKIKYRKIGAGGWNQPENVVSDYEIEKMPTVDAVPVDEFKLHHIMIDKEGVPEVKLQFGDRLVILRTEPVDVVEVVHGRWKPYHEADIGYDEYGVRCSNCGFEVEDHEVKFIMHYCPKCGAKMDGVSDG